MFNASRIIHIAYIQNFAIKSVTVIFFFFSEIFFTPNKQTFQMNRFSYVLACQYETKGRTIVHVLSPIWALALVSTNKVLC